MAAEELNASHSLTQLMSVFAVRNFEGHPYFQIVCHSFLQAELFSKSQDGVCKINYSILCVWRRWRIRVKNTLQLMRISTNLVKRWLEWPVQATLVLFQSAIELDLFSNYLINFSAVDNTRAKTLGHVVWVTVIGIIFSSIQFNSVAQSCPALCDPMNHSTPGLPVHNILLALLPGRKLVNTGVFFVSKIYVC